MQSTPRQLSSLCYRPETQSGSEAVPEAIVIIDQTRLPHRFETIELQSLEGCCQAIEYMWVRGAPLIGVTAAYGLAFGLREDGSGSGHKNAVAQLLATRPTAVNLAWALEQVNQALRETPEEQKYEVALACARELMNEDIKVCDQIGQHGLDVLKEIISHKQHVADGPLNIMTHCNAGWLATIGIGTALAPVYKAIEAGLNVHVWVSETRPRNQGAALTAWELEQAGVNYTVIADNAAGHLMQTGQVDICLVGSDRTTSRGDVCNKIGTYLKAVAARENNVPFYAALPVSTIDWQISDGLREIVIEQRSSEEVTHINGKYADTSHARVQLTPETAEVSNYAFDVTPAKFITGLITEYGVYKANKEELQKLKNSC